MTTDTWFIAQLTNNLIHAPLGRLVTTLCCATPAKSGCLILFSIHVSLYFYVSDRCAWLPRVAKLTKYGGQLRKLYISDTTADMKQNAQDMVAV